LFAVRVSWMLLQNASVCAKHSCAVYSYVCTYEHTYIERKSTHFYLVLLAFQNQMYFSTICAIRPFLTPTHVAKGGVAPVQHTCTYIHRYIYRGVHTDISELSQANISFFRSYFLAWFYVRFLFSFSCGTFTTFRHFFITFLFGWRFIGRICWFVVLLFAFLFFWRHGLHNVEVVQ